MGLCVSTDLDQDSIATIWYVLADLIRASSAITCRRFSSMLVFEADPDIKSFKLSVRTHTRTQIKQHTVQDKHFGRSPTFVPIDYKKDETAPP